MTQTSSNMGAVAYIACLVVANVAFMPLLEAKEVVLEAKGILAPIFATVDKYNNIKTDNIRQYAQFLKDRSVKGVVVGSTTGEGPSLTVYDKKMLIDAWVDACRSLDMYVIAEVGAIPLPDAQELAAYAEKANVDGIMVQPEIYYKAKNTKELVYDLQLIAKSAPKTAIIYDDYPAYTGVYVNIEDFLDQATEKISNFKGVKTDSFSNALKIQDKLIEGQRIFVSEEIYLLPAALIGFDNFIIRETNVFPELTRDIIKYAQRGDLKKSRSLFRRWIDLKNTINDDGNLATYPAMKAAMTLVTGIEVGDILPPQIPLTDEEKSALEVRLRENGVKIIDYDYDD